MATFSYDTPVMEELISSLEAKVNTLGDNIEDVANELKNRLLSEGGMTGDTPEKLREAYISQVQPIVDELMESARMYVGMSREVHNIFAEAEAKNSSAIDAI